MSLFNPIETTDFIVRFSDGSEHYITENFLQNGQIMYIPERVTVVNNYRIKKTRFIFKIGYGVGSSGDWRRCLKSKL